MLPNLVALSLGGPFRGRRKAPLSNLVLTLRRCDDGGGEIGRAHV